MARFIPLVVALAGVEEGAAGRITEIRLRSGRPLVLTTAAEDYFSDAAGTLYPADSPSWETAAARVPGLLQTTHAQLAECFRALCSYSVHSYEACIRAGFVPLTGGHRAGICGTALVQSGAVCDVKDITSINVRIARTSLTECCPALRALLRTEQSVIVAGAPGSGKTTVLRAAARALSEDGARVAIVDERYELAPVEHSGFCAPMPLHCDVLSGYPKHAGMLHALRGLAPDVILCDEIGGMEDVQAVEQAANAGVRLVVTLHAKDTQQLLRRPQARALLKTGIFTSVVFLAGRQAPGTVERVESIAHVD